MNTSILPAQGNRSPLSLDRLSSGAQRQTRKELEQVIVRSVVAEAREQGRALLANAAMLNASSLSALEAHLIEVAPLGEARYKHLADSYTMGAAMAIQRW